MLRPKKREGFSELYEKASHRKDITINCCESGDGDTTPACSNYSGQNQGFEDLTDLIEEVGFLYIYCFYYFINNKLLKSLTIITLF